MTGYSEAIKNQFQAPDWIIDSGLDLPLLKEKCIEISNGCDCRITKKSKIIEFILDNAQIAVCSDEIFADVINHGGIMTEIRDVWKREEYDNITLFSELESVEKSFAFTADEDFGHVAPDWEAVLKLGITGIINRIETYFAGKKCSKEQIAFYEASLREWRAVQRLLVRLSYWTGKKSEEENKLTMVSEVLKNLSERPPQTLHEAFQLMFIVYFVQTNVEGENVRSLGMLDRLMYPFYKADINSGIADIEDEKELIKRFMYRFYSANVIANIPFGICGTDRESKDQTNELSYLLVEAYGELNIISPKIHVLCNKNTPKRILDMSFEAIRKGNNSILFANDEIISVALEKIGIEKGDCANHLLVGCYEPAVIGKEIPCSCNGRISLPKAVEFALSNGIDLLSGERNGIQTGEPDTFLNFSQFFDAVIKQYEFFADKVMEKIRIIESKYMEINPSPFLSGTLLECVDRGIDAYCGGAKYNNSSINVFGLATAADSLYVIYKMVYIDKRFTAKQFVEILKENWNGYEHLRHECKYKIEKFGNNQYEVDLIAANLAERAAKYINGKPNGRGGCFRCGMFSIDWRMIFGEHEGASADGRKAGEPISKNIGAATAMDKSGITALIQSASKIDYSLIPNGTVLDLMLHPTATCGETGLNAMRSILKVFFLNGGFALHCNVVDTETLKKAQKNPELYSSLQIRLCGWNVYFVDLTFEEQNEFIKQSEMIQ